MYNFHHHTSAIQSISFHSTMNFMVRPIERKGEMLFFYFCF